jgi:hypothetical protein
MMDQPPTACAVLIPPSHREPDCSRRIALTTCIYSAIRHYGRYMEKSIGVIAKLADRRNSLIQPAQPQLRSGI